MQEYEKKIGRLLSIYDYFFRNSTYDEGSGDKKKPDRIKVVDTEDCSRGPLSGCIRLADSSRVIQRLKVIIRVV